jgi:cytochrome c-type biogenesis protein CcsB
MEAQLFNIAFAAYSVSALLYIAYALTKKEGIGRVGFLTLGFALLFHVASLVARTLMARAIPEHGWYVPWSNWFESFSFFGGVITAVFFAVQNWRRLNILGAFVVPLAWVMLLVSLSHDRSIPHLAPALQSYWMSIHVPVMFLSYSAFANAFALGLAYLIQQRQIKSKKPSELSYALPPLEDIDRLIYTIIAFAFPILTLGVMLGARWAYDAWGRYWGWDPKETWALITWLVYLVYLHMRLVIGWRGRKSVYLSMAGFGVVLFTYAGVNYLSALHGFLSGQGR